MALHLNQPGRSGRRLSARRLIERPRQQTQRQEIVLVAHFTQADFLKLGAELFPSLRPAPDSFLLAHAFIIALACGQRERSGRRNLDARVPGIPAFGRCRSQPLSETLE